MKEYKNATKYNLAAFVWCGSKKNWVHDYIRGLGVLENTTYEYLGYEAVVRNQLTKGCQMLRVVNPCILLAVSIIFISADLTASFACKLSNYKVKHIYGVCAFIFKQNEIISDPSKVILLLSYIYII